jgi:uncharacterized membrane protein
MAKTAQVEAAKPKSLEKVVQYLLVFGGAAGLFASFMITLDKFKLLQNPHFVPNCDLNPVLSCGTVMQTTQSNAFGFPNPWIGLAAFSVLITIGAAMLAGAKFKRWFWLGLEVGILLGLAFALWLLFESIYSINALCPYCLLVDIVVISSFWYTSLYLVETGHLKFKGKAITVAAFARKHHLDILALIFVAIIVLILNHFWYYYGQFLH